MSPGELILKDLIGERVIKAKPPGPQSGWSLSFLEGRASLMICECELDGFTSLGELAGATLESVESSERNTVLRFTGNRAVRVEHCFDYNVGPDVMFYTRDGKIAGVF